MKTRQQRWAARAYECVGKRKGGAKEREYQSFSKSFPALLHTAGLCQALAFAEAKEHGDYLDDLAEVLGQDRAKLHERSRREEVAQYQRLSRETMQAATWLKRYAEALLEGGSG